MIHLAHRTYVFRSDSSHWGKESVWDEWMWMMMVVNVMIVSCIMQYFRFVQRYAQCDTKIWTEIVACKKHSGHSLLPKRYEQYHGKVVTNDTQYQNNKILTLTSRKSAISHPYRWWLHCSYYNRRKTFHPSNHSLPFCLSTFFRPLNELNTSQTLGVEWRLLPKALHK